MKIILAISITALTFFSCNQPDKNSPLTITDSIGPVASTENTDSVVVPEPKGEKQEKIISLLKKLPECERSSRYLDSLTNHEQSLAYMIFPPEKGEKDYYVKAGYSSRERFETYYNFYVDSATFAIKIDDVIEGEIVTLAEWRKREKQRK